MAADPVFVNARGMRCPWPALRAARAMRDAGAIVIEADDPIAATELEALAQTQGWTFAALGDRHFGLSRTE
ncbi:MULTISPECIES: sulfurtransferase TusA family protein [Sphingobium]|uniref:Redox protein n=2 Tax=Sphingobium cupriresistens TaxID=1132417 RepID=A0A0J7Y0B2_9SPHN|nr:MULTISPECIES: sulfurtransferase TusA family protein [Sphingobium]KMS57336.1 redox protein [Sphingobium cupriresistens LL01]MBJ7377557.1 sulfurtransferase TusA family protein [Sphingobium sp.]RYM14850.1 sulfurtransferase TusA family protein [Sphingobium cupriresistens]